MKKSLRIILATIMLVVLSVTFIACSNDDTKPNTDDNKSYSVVVEDGVGYTARVDKNSAKSGEEVIVSINFPPYYEIESVMANTTKCDKNDNGTYKFTMPSEDVKVKIVLKEAADEILESSGMTWSIVSDEITPKNESGDYETIQEFEVYFGEKGIFPTTDNNMMLSKVRVFSTNQDVIPDEALLGVKKNDDNGSVCFYGALNIDRTLIKEGSTTVVVEDTQSHRLITKHVKVVPYGTANPGQIWTNKVKIDLSGLTGEYTNFRIFITDKDHVSGSVYSEYQNADFSRDQDGFEFEFSYIASHEFSINVAYEYFDEKWGENRYKNLNIINSAGAGLEGIYNGDTLHFAADGNMIVVKVTD